mgnify:CR=1 FL=1
MLKFMNALHCRFEPFMNARWFKSLMLFIIFLNPFAIIPQVYQVCTSTSVEGVSLFTWCIFGAIQTALAFEAVRTKSVGIFFSMAVSVVESTTIIVVTYLRSS